MKRIIVKIGSQVLCQTDGLLNTETLAELVSQVAELHKKGWQVLLVSSGAVAAGQGEINSDRLHRQDPVTRKQVLAALGQVRLMQTYHLQFKQHGLAVAQILASKSDFQTRNHYLNMRRCIEGVLDAGIVPVVNENDVVSITELMFTDNDELAGLLAGIVKADLMCILSSVDGVLNGALNINGIDTEPRVIPSWDEKIHKIDSVVSSGTNKLGRGGMYSKIKVACKTAALGTEVVIANGSAKNVLLRVAEKELIGTRFPAAKSSTSARRWLASSDDHAVGSIIINEGAVQALTDKSRLASLLLVGVEAFEGEFKRGDVVRVTDRDGAVLALGRADYDSTVARNLIGQRDHKPLIHYNYLYLSGST
ncbi:MAG: glutamate 5-kinase [Lysobacterales bacterium]|jgi:glutamate 5-kinase